MPMSHPARLTATCNKLQVASSAVMGDHLYLNLRFPMSAMSLKARLLAGEARLAAFLFTDSADVAEIMAVSGFDALIVDREHVASDMERAVGQLRAIRCIADIPVLVRLRDHGEGSIKPLLDAGFDGIVAANVTSAAAAGRLVAASHYPPLGRRGAQFTVSRAARYGLDAGEAVKRARADTLLIAMIESAAGLAAIPEIAAVPSIDMLFIGPLDLSADFGTYGDLTHPDLRAAIATAERSILQSGVMLAGALLPDDTARAAFARGYRLVTGASDVGLLLAAARSAATW